MNMREITYHDVSPYAAESAAAAADYAQDFSDTRNLFAENMAYGNIQTCEHNHTILDGTYRELTKDSVIPLWSNVQSLYPSRLLSESVTLNISFGGYQSSPGITLYFDAQNGVWCDTLRIKWYKDGALLADEMFYPDSAAYTCHKQVDLYNKVTIGFIRLNMPCRFLKLERILFGIVRVFGDGDLENITINEGFNPTGRTLYINSANFTFNTDDSIPYIFMKRQPLYIKYNGIHMGSYYIDKSKKYADRRYSVEAVDKIGVLDACDDFMGGIYSNIGAEELIDRIVGGIFQVEIDGSLKNIPVSGWLPIMKRRDALAQVAVAIGAMTDSSGANAVKVKPVPQFGGLQDIKEIEDNRVYQSASMDIEFPCTAIELTEHNFTVGGTVRELYSDVFTGDKTVRFSEPVSNLTIQNGSIISWGANHAVIRGTGNSCVLKGQPYIDSISSVIIRNNDNIEGTQERIEKIENCYLVNKSNSREVARRLYEYYSRQNVFDGDFLIEIQRENPENAEKIGDIVKIARISGQIEKLTLRLGSKNIKARGIIRGD